MVNFAFKSGNWTLILPKHTTDRDIQPDTELNMGDIPVLWSRRHDAVFVVLTLASILLLLALVTYSGRDMAWSAAGAGSPGNAVGKVGALVADILFHALGYLAYAVPLLVMAKLGQLFRKSPAASGRVRLAPLKP